MKKQNTNNQREENGTTPCESSFRIRTYGKGELAMCYIRGVCQHTAVKQFNTWILVFPGLKDRLEATGMQRGCRHYTPAQVRLIVEAFGEP